MSSDKKKTLDRLLEQWGDSHRASEDQLIELASGIRDRLADQPAPLADLSTNERELEIFTNRYRWWIGTAAAACAAMVFFVFLLPNTVIDTEAPVSPQVVDPSMPNAFCLGKRQLAEKATLVRELQAIFPNQFAWFSEIDQRMQIGLLPDRAMPSKEEDIVVVRFTLVTRAPAETRWTPLRIFDVVAKGQELVELVPSTANDPRVLMWTYPLPDQMVSVDVQIDMGGPTPFRVDSCSIQDADSTEEIYRFEKDGVQYRLYQAAVLLKNDDWG